MEYVNPFGAMAPVGQTDLPVLREMDIQNRNNLAMPFIEMARKQQEMEQQKKAFDMQEHMSPLAQQARTSGLQKQVQMNQDTTRLSPFETDAKILEAKRAIELNPQITEQKRLEAEQAAMKIKGTPAATFFNEIATVNEHIKAYDKAAPGAGQFLAEKYITQWKARHPGQPVPPMMEKYDPAQWDIAALIGLNSAEQQNKAKLQTQKDAADIQQTRMRGESAENVARINAQGRTDAIQAKPTPPQRIPRTSQEALIYYNEDITNPEVPLDQKVVAGRRLQPHLQGMAEKEVNARQLDVAQKKTAFPTILRGLENQYIFGPLLKQMGLPFDPNKYRYSFNASTGAIDREELTKSPTKK